MFAGNKKKVQKKLKKIWKYEKPAVPLQKKQQTIILCEIGILNTAMLKRLKKSPIANIATSIRWQNIIIAS